MTREIQTCKLSFGGELDSCTLSHSPMDALEKNLIPDAGNSNFSIISCDSLLKTTASAHTAF